jgi:hypothetical protein
VLAALPSVVAALPVSTAKVQPATLLQRIQQSGKVAYSGYAESDGGLALPVTSQFSSIGDLFGGHRQLRVWWRTVTDWRLDSVGYSGETDIHNTDIGYWTWNYEANQATFTQQSTDPRVRLPTDTDLLPPELARRLLSQATASETSSIDSRRIAGIDASGIRIRPDSSISTIDHIDVWADTRTGLPVQVSVYGKGSANAGLTSHFLDLSLSLPSAASTSFEVPSGARVQSGAGQDLATTLDQLGGASPPTALAGVPRNPDLPSLGSVGVYGRGITEFIVVPLPRRVAFSLRNQLSPATQQASGPASSDPGPVVLGSGPLNLLLTAFNAPNGPWLLVGTVTPQTLATAAQQLPENPGRR